jgi:hypothetical protein
VWLCASQAKKYGIEPAPLARTAEERSAARIAALEQRVEELEGGLGYIVKCADAYRRDPINIHDRQSSWQRLGDIMDAIDAARAEGEG